MQQLKTYKAGIKCHTVVTHRRPHPEEITELLLCKHGYAEHVHPGIKDAVKNLRIEFWDAGSETPDGKPWQDWHQRGYVLFGVGGSPYDEHVLPESHDECSLTLFAKALRIDKKPELQQIIRVMHQNDRKGGKDPLGFSAMLNGLHSLYFEQGEEQAKEVIRMAMFMLEPKLVLQSRFFTDTKNEYPRKANAHKGTYLGREITIVSIISDDEQIEKFARSEYGHNADVVITKNSRGHVYISTASESKIVLDTVMRYINRQELLEHRIPFHPADPRLNSTPCMGLTIWHYHKPARKIMNGSLSAPGKKPTKIPFRKIVQIVLDGLADTPIIKKIPDQRTSVAQ